ncbi:MAG: polysaccharide biosynthesis/export family protein [Candidatus Omnitrophica bacterium]|nr:polysaccharide biosynthesis/export family protein [Candidatus Omnitrophota bacterium]
MNRVSKYIFTGAGIAVWVAVVTVGSVFAQNFTGVIATGEPMPAFLTGTDEPLVDVPLAGPGQVQVQEFSTEGSGGIPDFIQEFSHYTLGKTDIIEISVLRHPEVSGEYTINSEGKIQYEFVGDVSIEGLTKKEIKEFLIKKLEEYIIAPEVTVKIVGYNSKIVYVVGEVGRPGKIFMRGDTITVREALVQAGLPRLTAKANKSHLITPSASGKPERKIVNVHKLLYEGDLRENLIMKPGDTLYVPPTFLAKTMRVMQPITQPMREASGAASTVYGF